MANKLPDPDPLFNLNLGKWSIANNLPDHSNSKILTHPASSIYTKEEAPLSRGDSFNKTVIQA
jgi:hypothetical protein